jgi:putative acetyltransferase
MIRSATSSDARALAVLHRESISELCRSDYSAEQVSAWLAPLQPALYEELARSRAMFVFAQDGALLGFGVCDPAQALVNAAYVHPSATRRGVGRALMAAMERVLSDHGAHEARLNATLNAVSFYQALGYAHRGRASNRLPSGIELPCELMSKTLGTR